MKTVVVITTICDEVALRRHKQYLAAIQNDCAFQKRYMFAAEVRISKNKTLLVEEDEGIMPHTKESLASLKTVMPNGVHTSDTQTHLGNGNAGMLITTRDRAKA